MAGLERLEKVLTSESCRAAARRGGKTLKKSDIAPSSAKPMKQDHCHTTTVHDRLA